MFIVVKNLQGRDGEEEVDGPEYGGFNLCVPANCDF
jgi:hypothetical protein